MAELLQTTLCYLEQNGCYLMLHRIKKKNDVNHDKWIGVGGKFAPGETAEACALREVWEETHIKVKNIRYFASQPWPYPCGLMVGFIAEYDSGDIQLQRSELNKGGWYSRDNMPAIPGEVSLARHLIDHWLAQ